NEMRWPFDNRIRGAHNEDQTEDGGDSCQSEPPASATGLSPGDDARQTHQDWHWREGTQFIGRVEGGIQLLSQDDHTNGEAEPGKKARQDELAAIRLCRPLRGYCRFHEAELLALLPLLQV